MIRTTTCLLRIFPIRRKWNNGRPCPASIDVSTRPNRAIISWASVTGADGYILQKKAAGEMSWSPLATIPDGSTTTYTATGLMNGTAIEFRVASTKERADPPGSTDWRTHAPVTPEGATLALTPAVSLTEGNINVASATLMLQQAAFVDPLLPSMATFSLTGLSFSSLTRTSATTASAVFAYEGADFDADVSNMVLSLAASAFTDDFIGSVNAGAVSVAAIQESATLTPTAMTEATLTTSGFSIRVDLTGETFAATLETSDFDVQGLPPGCAFAGVTRNDSDTATLDISYNDRDFDEDAVVTVVCKASGLSRAGSISPDSFTITHTASETAALALVNRTAWNDDNLDGTELRVTLANEEYAASIDATDFAMRTSQAIPGLRIASVVRESNTAAKLTLAAADNLDLDSNVTLNVGVMASGQKGTGADTLDASWTNPSTVIAGVQEPAPAAPTNLTALPLSNSVEVNWTDPGDSGIIRYESRYRSRNVNNEDGDYTDWTTVPGSDDTTTTHTFTGLTNGRSHEFQIRAIKGYKYPFGLAASARATPNKESAAITAFTQSDGTTTPVTEANLDGSKVTVSLSSRIYNSATTIESTANIADHFRLIVWGGYYGVKWSGPVTLMGSDKAILVRSALPSDWFAGRTHDVSSILFRQVGAGNLIINLGEDGESGQDLLPILESNLGVRMASGEETLTFVTNNLSDFTEPYGYSSADIGRFFSSVDAGDEVEITMWWNNGPLSISSVSRTDNSNAVLTLATSNPKTDFDLPLRFNVEALPDAHNGREVLATESREVAPTVEYASARLVNRTHLDEENLAGAVVEVSLTGDSFVAENIDTYLSGSLPERHETITRAVGASETSPLTVVFPSNDRPASSASLRLINAGGGTAFQDDPEDSSSDVDAAGEWHYDVSSGTVTFQTNAAGVVSVFANKGRFALEASASSEDLPSSGMVELFVDGEYIGDVDVANTGSTSALHDAASGTATLAHDGTTYTIGRTSGDKALVSDSSNGSAKTISLREKGAGWEPNKDITATARNTGVTGPFVIPLADPYRAHSSQPSGGVLGGGASWRSLPEATAEAVNADGKWHVSGNKLVVQTQTDSNTDITFTYKSNDVSVHGTALVAGDFSVSRTSASAIFRIAATYDQPALGGTDTFLSLPLPSAVRTGATTISNVSVPVSATKPILRISTLPAAYTRTSPFELRTGEVRSWTLAYHFLDPGQPNDARLSYSVSPSTKTHGITASVSRGRLELRASDELPEVRTVVEFTVTATRRLGADVAHSTATFHAVVDAAAIVFDPNNSDRPGSSFPSSTQDVLTEPDKPASLRLDGAFRHPLETRFSAFLEETSSLKGIVDVETASGLDVVVRRNPTVTRFSRLGLNGGSSWRGWQRDGWYVTTNGLIFLTGVGADIRGRLPDGQAPPSGLGSVADFYINQGDLRSFLKGRSILRYISPASAAPLPGLPLPGDFVSPVTGVLWRQENETVDPGAPSYRGTIAAMDVPSPTYSIPGSYTLDGQAARVTNISFLSRFFVQRLTGADRSFLNVRFDRRLSVDGTRALAVVARVAGYPSFHTVAGGASRFLAGLDVAGELHVRHRFPLPAGLTLTSANLAWTAGDGGSNIAPADFDEVGSASLVAANSNDWHYDPATGYLTVGVNRTGRLTVAPYSNLPTIMTLVLPMESAGWVNNPVKAHTFARASGNKDPLARITLIEQQGSSTRSYYMDPTAAAADLPAVETTASLSGVAVMDRFAMLAAGMRTTDVSTNPTPATMDAAIVDRTVRVNGGRNRTSQTAADILNPWVPLSLRLLSEIDVAIENGCPEAAKGRSPRCAGRRRRFRLHKGTGTVHKRHRIRHRGEGEDEAPIRARRRRNPALPALDCHTPSGGSLPSASGSQPLGNVVVDGRIRFVHLEQPFQRGGKKGHADSAQVEEGIRSPVVQAARPALARGRGIDFRRDVPVGRAGRLPGDSGLDGGLRCGVRGFQQEVRSGTGDESLDPLRNIDDRGHHGVCARWYSPRETCPDCRKRVGPSMSQEPIDGVSYHDDFKQAAGEIPIKNIDLRGTYAIAELADPDVAFARGRLRVSARRGQDTETVPYRIRLVAVNRKLILDAEDCGIDPYVPRWLKAEE